MKENDNNTRHGGLLKAFGQWLQENSFRFGNRPLLLGKGSECQDILFDRVTSELSFSICESGDAGIWVTYQDKFWDCVAEFDVWERRTPSGQYYCEGCIDRKFFPSQRDLWEEHIFEPLIEWTEENLSTSNWLCIFGIGGWTWASIEPEDRIESVYGEEGFVVALPVVENFPRRNP